MKLIIIRHGDPDYELDSLTPRGWREAELLADRVEKWDVRDFYCSPLGRAQNTANVSLHRIGRTAETLDWLTEFEIEVDDPRGGRRNIAWDLLPSFWTTQEGLYDRDGWADASVNATGAIRAGFDRVKTGLDALLLKYGYRRSGRLYTVENGGSDATVVCFCHMGVMFVMLGYLCGLPAPVLWHTLCVAPTGITVTETEEREEGTAMFRTRVIGDTAHLYTAGVQPSSAAFFEERRPAEHIADWWEPAVPPCRG